MTFEGAGGAAGPVPGGAAGPVPGSAAGSAVDTAAGAAVEEAHGELSLARVALAEDDLPHAAEHVSAAMAYAPGLPEVHELLAVLAGRSPDGGVGLFPLGERAYIGAVVAHAHLLAPSEPATALGLLAQATAFEPGRPWADAPWVRALDVLTVAPDAIAQVFVGVMRHLGDPAPEPVRRCNEVYLDLARRAAAGYPEHPLLLATAAGIGRRLGATGLAVHWGERAVALARNKLTLVWYAYALKADGRLDDAMRVMRDARAQYPLDLDLCADLANWLAESDRLDEALALIEEAMRIDPSYDCAVHTAHRLRYLRDGDVGHLVALVDFIREYPVTSHDHVDLADCCHARPWLGRLAPTTEACVNVLAQVPPEQRGGLTNLSLSALEVPSALALLRRACPEVRIEIEGPPPADMVAPLRPGAAPLWRYSGTVAAPAVAPPAPRSARLLAEVATATWPHPVAAFDLALPLGQLPAGELLALLVHPPERPTGHPALPDGWWERGAQVFACLGLLHCAELGTGGPGDTTERRRLLTGIAYGVEDWTTEAALFALVVAAWTDPSCRDEVCETVGRRFLAAIEATRHRCVTILDSLAELVRITPGMDAEVVALARDVLAANADGGADDGAGGGAGGAGGGDGDGERSGDGAAHAAGSAGSAGSGAARRSRLGRLFGRGR